ncbi:hypothetical protein C8F01DRAFT_1088275 [Mycena amicta]|nr:hypothetical protein C8F01DRAFT_1088275 [Mycena amicta]
MWSIKSPSFTFLSSSGATHSTTKHRTRAPSQKHWTRNRQAPSQKIRVHQYGWHPPRRIASWSSTEELVSDLEFYSQVRQSALQSGPVSVNQTKNNAARTNSS